MSRRTWHEDAPGVREPVAALDRVRLVECGEPMRYLPEACPGIRVNLRCRPWLRESVCVMLNQAAGSLPDGFGLQVNTAWRLLSDQERMYWRVYRQMQQDHPHWKEPTLRRMVNRWFAPPDRKAPPGHCTGGAVDVALVNAEGHPYDLSAPYKQWDGAFTYIHGLTDEAARLRALLYEAMVNAGFSNCREEWWHYSYGDAAWAVRNAQSTCRYGLVGHTRSGTPLPCAPQV